MLCAKLETKCWFPLTFRLRKSYPWIFPVAWEWCKFSLPVVRWCKSSKNLAEAKAEIKRSEFGKPIMRVYAKPIICKVSFDIFLLTFFTSNFLISAKISGKVSNSPQLFWQKFFKSSWTTSSKSVECWILSSNRIKRLWES